MTYDGDEMIEWGDRRQTESPPLQKQPKTPKKIVVYSHYGKSVYFDGWLVRHFSVDGCNPYEWRYRCTLLGIEFDHREVRWEDWPGQKQNSGAVHNPPADI